MQRRNMQIFLCTRSFRCFSLLYASQPTHIVDCKPNPVLCFVIICRVHSHHKLFFASQGIQANMLIINYNNEMEQALSKKLLSRFAHFISIHTHIAIAIKTDLLLLRLKSPLIAILNKKKDFFISAVSRASDNETQKYHL